MQDQKEIQLTLAAFEVAAILQVLGKLPTEVGAYPLFMKIKKQSEKELSENEDQDQNS